MYIVHGDDVRVSSIYCFVEIVVSAAFIQIRIQTSFRTTLIRNHRVVVLKDTETKLNYYRNSKLEK